MSDYALVELVEEFLGFRPIASDDLGMLALQVWDELLMTLALLVPVRLLHRNKLLHTLALLVLFRLV